MFFWFIGTAVVAVGFVFRDPAFDHRLLVIGSLVPLLDGLTGGIWVLHSVTVSIVLLAVVMLATAGRRPVRAVLLGLPIGMLLHLVFDGVWTDSDTFWWPFTGLAVPDGPLPVVARGPWSLLLEVIGVAICVWLWRRSSLGRPERRRRFLVDGRLTATVRGV